MSLSFLPFSYLVVVGAGVSVALQQVLNANLRVQLGSPWWAAFVSYLVGMLISLVIALVVSGPRLAISPMEGASWLAWSGGLFGVIFIGTAVLMLPSLGAATVLSLIVVGQMVGSLVFDHFGILGLPQQPISLIRLAGAACLVVGVVLIRKA